MADFFEKKAQMRAEREASGEQRNSAVTAEPQSERDMADKLLDLVQRSMPILSPSISVMKELKGSDNMNAADAAGLSFGNAATFGASGALQRYGGAAMDYVGSSGEISFDELLQRRTEARDALMDKHPLASLAGNVAGSLTGTKLAGKALEAVAPAAVGAMLKTAPRRVGSLAAAGAAENVATSAGEGHVEDMGDVLQQGALGAAFGGGGQLVGEALNAGRRVINRTVRGKIDESDAYAAAGRSLMDDAIGKGSIAAEINDGKGLTEQTLRDMAATAGGPRKQLFSEANPDMLRIHEGMLSHPELIGRFGPTKEMLTRRAAGRTDEVGNMLLDNLVDSNRAVTGDAAREANEAARKEASAAYRGIFDSASGRTAPVVSKKRVLDAAKSLTDEHGTLIFDMANATSSRRNAYEFFESELGKLGATAKGTPKNITLAGVQNLKLELDRAIRQGYASDDDAVRRMATGDLVALKTMVNDWLKSSVPEYAAASKKFADTMSVEEASKLGGNIIKGNNKGATRKELEQLIATMSDSERSALEDGALNWLKEQSVSSPGFLKRLSQNDGMQHRLEAVFGRAAGTNATTVDDLLSQIDRRITDDGIRKRMSTSLERGASQATAAPDSESVQSMFDLYGVVSKLLGRQFSSGTLTSSARRLSDVKQNPAQQVILDLMQAETPEAANKIIDMMLGAMKKPNATPKSGRIGSALATGIQGLSN